MGKKRSVWDFQKWLVICIAEQISGTFEHASDSEIPQALKSIFGWSPFKSPRFGSHLETSVTI